MKILRLTQKEMHNLGSIEEELGCTDTWLGQLNIIVFFLFGRTALDSWYCTVGPST